MKKSVVLLIFISIFCKGCFVIPKFRIYRAFQNQHCQILSSTLIYNLSVDQLNQAVDVCSKKKMHEQALILLKYLESQELPSLQKIEIWRQKVDIYMNYLSKYPEAIQELEKILTYKKNDYSIWQLLIRSRIKNQSFQKALKDTKHLLGTNLSKEQRLKTQFVQARLLLLLQRRQQALEIFSMIKKEDEEFFKQHQGPFYTALLLEEEKKFLEAIKELEIIQWPFAEEKKEHWMNRNKNAPGI